MQAAAKLFLKIICWCFSHSFSILFLFYFISVIHPKSGGFSANTWVYSTLTIPRYSFRCFKLPMLLHPLEWFAINSSRRCKRAIADLIWVCNAIYISEQLATMDLTSIFLFCLISLVIGAVLMILVQYYIFIKYFNQPDNDPSASQRNRSLNERYQLPDVSFTLIDLYCSNWSLKADVTHQKKKKKWERK